MSNSKANFGVKPYARSKFNEISNVIVRSFADNFPGSPADLRLTALTFNPSPACYFCGVVSCNGEQTNPTDHIFPVARGGLSVQGNFGHICHNCNSAKGALHPLTYWRKRKEQGQDLWIEDEDAFVAWLDEATAPYKQAYPKFYEVSSRLEQTQEDLDFLKGEWTAWYKAQVIDFTSDSFWRGDGNIAKADHLRKWLPVLWPNYNAVTPETQTSYLVQLGLLVELFGDDAEKILEAVYPEESFFETISAQIDALYRDKGSKNRQAQKYTAVCNAVLNHCYKSETKYKKSGRKNAPAADPIEQALNNCKANNSNLKPGGSRLKRRLSLTKQMAEYKQAKGLEEASKHFSKIYWAKSGMKEAQADARKGSQTTRKNPDRTEMSDMRHAARAAGISLDRYGMTSLKFGN